MDQPGRPVRQRQDRLATAITGTAILLAAILAAGAIFRARGPLIVEIPSFVPAISGTAGLAALGVAFLVLGRYRVVRDPSAFWIALSFSALGVLYIFFLLTWPGARANGEGIIARLPGTSAWIAFMQNGVLALTLLAAATARWPGAAGRVSRRWFVWVAAWVSLWLLIGVLVVVLEDRISGVNLQRTDARQLALALILLLDALGAAAGAYRYLQTGERLLAYVALAGLWALGSGVASLLTQARYDAWWYLFRLLAMAPILVMLYGVLMEYVGLFRRERERSDELQRQRALFEAVLAQMPAGVLVAEAPSGRLLMHTPHDRELAYGLPTPNMPYAEEYSVSHGYHTDGRPYLAGEWPLDRALRRGDIVQDEEMRIDSGGGERAIVSVSAAPVRDSSGHIMAAVAIHLDMTQRRRDEQALRESEARLRDVLQNSRDVLYRLNLVTQSYDYFSPAVEALTGYTFEEVLRMGPEGIKRLVHSDDLPTYEAHTMAMLQSSAREPLHTLEYRWLTKGGEYRWFSVHRQLIRDADGRPLADIGSIRDITESQEAELAQRRLAEQRQLALDAARMGWWHYDLQTRIITYDARFREIWGLSGNQSSPEEVLKRVHPKGRPSVRAAITAALDPSSPHLRGGEFRVVRDDGSVRWVAAYGVPIVEVKGATKRATGMVGTAADVTERKEAEMALQAANAELMRFNRTMVNRELRMIELKREINDLCACTGKPPRYSLDPPQEGL